MIKETLFIVKEKRYIRNRNTLQFFLEILKETIGNVLEVFTDENKNNDNYKNEIKKEFKNTLGLLIEDFSSEDKKEIEEEIFNYIKNSLEKKIALVGNDNFNMILRQLIIQVLDQQWKQHLLALDNLRQGIGLELMHREILK